MKKSISIFSVVILTIMLAACRSGGAEEKIYKKFHAMQNYAAEAEITVYGNKGNTIYAVRQFYEEPNKFRCEVLNDAGEVENVFVSGGEQMKVQSFKFEKRTVESAKNSIDYMAAHEFFGRYFEGGNSSGRVPADGGDILLKLEDSSGRYRFCQNMWLDEKTLLPKRLVTFDMDGGETLSVEYSSFVINQKNFDVDFSVE